MQGLVPRGARKDLALEVLSRVLPTVAPLAIVRPLVRYAEEWWLASGTKAQRAQALDPPTLVRAFARAARADGGKLVWRQRRCNPIVGARHVTQRIGWRWLNASTLEVPHVGRVSLAESGPAMVRRLALHGLTRAFRSGALLKAPPSLIHDLGVSVKWGPWTRPLQGLIA